MADKDDRLKNEGLKPEERELFSDKRPFALPPVHDYIEKFLNWSRANSLWILGFGTGCGAVELALL